MRTRLLLAPLVLLAGCTLGPKYRRPAVAVPEQFRGAQPAPGSLADTKWFDLFQDEALTAAVRAALEHNFDLEIATQRVLQARALLGITHADQLPLVTGQASFSTSRPSYIGSNPMQVREGALNAAYTQAGVGVTWDLDLWGRLRRLNEAARAEYLATEEARRGVVVALVGDVMSGYFTMRERDLELEIAGRTRDIAQNSLKLVELRHARGAATGLDVHQAEQILYTATSQIAAARRDIEQTENAVSLLCGRAPGEVRRGQPLEGFAVPAAIPAGLPSALLERRPDIRRAEQTLIAANARIGAARALYFPQITLTGYLGAQTRYLTDFFAHKALLASSAAPAVLAPIFNAGRTRATVRFSQAQQREMLATYQRTIYTALREVSDALASSTHTREQREQQERLVKAQQDSERLSNLRYKGGLDSYLQVLDSQRNLFAGQLRLAQLRLQELQSLVQLYRALGGAWQ